MKIVRSSIIIAVLIVLVACILHMSNIGGTGVWVNNRGRGIKHRHIRVISLAPSITEIICALGAADNLVGVTDQCDYPEFVREKPKIGSMISPSIERITVIRPDYAIMTKTGGNRIESAFALERAGITIISVSDSTVAELKSAFRTIGRLLESEDIAETLVSRLEASVGRYRSAAEKRKGQRVAVIVSHDPFFAAGRNTLYDDILRLAEMKNIVHWRSYRELSAEVLLAAPPAIILDISGAGIDWWNERYPSVAKKAEILILDRDAFSRPGPRFHQALDTLARLLSE